MIEYKVILVTLSPTCRKIERDLYYIAGLLYFPVASTGASVVLVTLWVLPSGLEEHCWLFLLLGPSAGQIESARQMVGGEEVDTKIRRSKCLLIRFSALV